MSPPSPQGRSRVLVTGATSGLGRGMAAELARRGFNVAVTGRRPDKLAETARLVRDAGGEALELVGGVEDPSVVRRHYAEIRSKWGGLDWAILNAGVGDSLNAREFRADNVRWTFDTNVFGAANWLEAVLPDMLAAGSGTVAGIASLAAWRGLPNSGSYCASKAALVTLLESARVDLARSGVRVVTVCPGFVKSELTDRNDPKLMPFLLETEDGVRRILDGIEAGRPLVHFPWQLSWPMRYVVRLLPPWLYDFLMTRAPRRHKKKYIDPSKSPAPPAR